MKFKFLSLLLVIFNIFSCVTYAEDDSSLNMQITSDSDVITSDAQTDDNVKSTGELVISAGQENTNIEKQLNEKSSTQLSLENINKQVISAVDTMMGYGQNRIKLKIYSTNIIAENFGVTTGNHYINFVNELFEKIISVVDEAPEAVTYAGSRLQACWLDYRWRPASGGVWEEKNLEIYVYEKCIQIENIYGYDFETLIFPVDDGKLVSDYLDTIKQKGLSGFNREAVSNSVISINEIDKKIDKIDFEFVVAESFKGEFTDSIADVGENINASLEHYTEGNSRDYYILTLNGSKSSVALWTTLSNTMLGGTGYWPSSNLPMEFSLSNCVKNGLLMFDSESTYITGILVQLAFSGNEVNSVKIACQIPYVGTRTEVLSKKPLIMLEVQEGTVPLRETTMANAVTGEKAIYTVYEDDDYSLSETFKEVDKETEIERLKADALKYGNVESQDPEKWVTRMRGVNTAGKVYDYKINFIAEIPLNSSNKYLPEWYKNLGDDVTAVIMGYTMNLKGVVSIDETMICFKGAQGSVWFENIGTSDDKTDIPNKIKAIDYDSLLSFDGNFKVKNTLEHETISAIMEFTNDSREGLKAITLDIGTASINADIDEFKYIGGGKIVYDKIW